MKRIILFVLSIFIGTNFFAQNTKEEYQDPAFWISLKADNNDVPVKFIDKDGNEELLNAPLRFIPKKDPKLKPMHITIDYIKYEVESETRQIVYLDGKVDLSCCRNKPINMEFYDEEGSLIQFSRTDNQGNFKLKSVNGNILEIKNKKLKVNFKKLKTIDENWDERFATLERKSVTEN